MIDDEKALATLIEAEKKLNEQIRTSANPKRRQDLGVDLKILEKQIKIQKRKIKKN